MKCVLCVCAYNCFFFYNRRSRATQNSTSSFFMSGSQPRCTNSHKMMMVLYCKIPTAAVTQDTQEDVTVLPMKKKKEQAKCSGDKVEYPPLPSVP